MSHPLIVKNTITIHAPATAVWDALTNPAQTRKYMFGCEALSDWKEGSPLIWKGNFNGIEVVAVKGSIVTNRPGQFLAYTTIDPNSTVPDLPENYLTVTYELKEEGDATLLTATQGDYSIVADGDNRYKHTIDGGGWSPILDAVKALVESDNP
jgi:uncharacterized protein YndB with AHSA1/START domain